MKILFVSLSGLEYDVSTPDIEPLGGQESCVAYLARHLAKKHEIVLIGKCDENEIMGVKHSSVELINSKPFFDQFAFDVIIVPSAPWACPHLRSMSPGSKLIMWNAMASDQPTVKDLEKKTCIDALDAIVYMSKWQKEETEKAFGIRKQSYVIGNGLAPSFENMFSSKKELMAAKQLRAAYTSAPYRGLHLLFDVHDRMQTRPMLDIFSSMRVYQADDSEFKPIYDLAKNNPLVNYHGAVSQTKLAQAMKPVAFLAYPCVFAETFCIAALDAMASGAKVVSTDLGALRNTTMGYADLMPLIEDNNDFVVAYKNLFEKSIREFQDCPDSWAEKMFEQLQKVNRLCKWEHRAVEWEHLLGQTLR